MPMLQVESLTVCYDKIAAVRNLSFSVPEGQIVALLGPNGAGKTTTVKCLSGLLSAFSGKIFFQGQEITRLKAHKRVKLGLAQSPEGRLLFPDLTVKENLEMGAYLRQDTMQIKKDLDFLTQLFPKLKERSSQLAGQLSGGEQQMVAIGRGLLSNPKLLILDEPSLGIAPILVKEIFKAIAEINKEKKLSILLIEQNVPLALSVSRQHYQLSCGELVS